MTSDILKTIIDNQITVDEYFLLKLLFEDYKSVPTYIDYMKYMHDDKLDIKSLQERNFIKIIDGEDGDLIALRGKGESLFVKNRITANNWIQEWIELFPAGVKSSGKFLRSDKASCLSKMNIFLKKYKYSKEDIFLVTKKYLEDRKRDNWKFTTCATYLISKDNVSVLASLLENKDSIKETPKLSEFEQEIK